MWDFVDNAELTALAESVYTQGGIVSAVCHGVAGLLSLKDTTGKPLITDKKVTGFFQFRRKPIRCQITSAVFAPR